MAMYDDLENARNWLKTGYRKPLAQQAAPGAGYQSQTLAPASPPTHPGASMGNQNTGVLGPRKESVPSSSGTVYKLPTPTMPTTQTSQQPAPAPAPKTTTPTWDPSKVTASTFTGFTPKHAMEGFDFGREQNTGKSAKDAFAFLSNNAPPPPTNDKAALGAWFNQYVAPGMNALGHKIISVDGDKFTFSNWQGTFTVDFGRGAGAAGGALAWQVDPDTAQMSNGAYTPQTVTPDGTVITPNPNASTTMPVGTPAEAISSAITYRRPYQSYVDDVPVPVR